MSCCETTGDVIWIEGKPYYKVKFVPVPKSEVPQIAPPKPDIDLGSFRLRDE